MSLRSIGLDEQLHDYVLASSLRESEVARRLRAETAKMENAGMQISPEQGQFMAFLAETIGARRTIEIGTFTGYSALCVASVLPDDGELIACDVNEEFTAVARRYWEEAGLANKIDLRIAPALETLDGLLQAGHDGTFDFAFIDADKDNNANYYERCLKLLRRGGIVAIDNAFRGGRIADPSNTEAASEILRNLTRKIRDDQSVALTLVPIGDGLIVARKR